MKIKEGFILRKVGKENVVVATGKASVLLNGIIKVNEAGTLLWNELINGADEKQLAEKLIAQYGISEDAASKDTAVFLDKLRAARCIED